MLASAAETYCRLTIAEQRSRSTREAKEFVAVQRGL